MNGWERKKGKTLVIFCKIPKIQKQNFLYCEMHKNWDVDFFTRMRLRVWCWQNDYKGGTERNEANSMQTNSSKYFSVDNEGKTF